MKNIDPAAALLAGIGVRTYIPVFRGRDNRITLTTTSFLLAYATGAQGHRLTLRRRQKPCRQNARVIPATNCSNLVEGLPPVNL